MWLALVSGVMANAAEVCAHGALAPQLDSVDEANEQGLEPEVLAGIVAGGLWQACPGLPAGVLEGLRGLEAALGPSGYALNDYRAAADAPHVWNDACVGGLTVLSEMAALPEPEKRPLLWEECALSHRGWFTQEEWTDARGSTVIALQVGAALDKRSATRDVTRRYVRALAGI